MEYAPLNRGIADLLNIQHDVSGFSIRVTEQHLNRNGVLHGGALCTLADWAMASSVLDLLPPGKTTATIDLNINYFRPAKVGDLLTTDVRIVNRGKTIIAMECLIKNQEEKVISKSAATFLLLDFDEFKRTSRAK